MFSDGIHLLLEEKRVRVNKHYLFRTRKRFESNHQNSSGVMMDHLVVPLRAKQPTDDEGKGSHLPVSNRIFCYYLFKISEGKIFTEMCDS